MPKILQLTQGKTALIDSEDYPFISHFKWHAVRIGKHWYAARGIGGSGGSVVYLHQYLMGGLQEVDHIDGDGLNCQKENMRPCTHKQNMANRKVRADSSTGVRNVTHNGRKKNPYTVTIQGKSYGTYPTLEQAEQVAKAKAKEIFGEFAATR